VGGDFNGNVTYLGVEHHVVLYSYKQTVRTVSHNYLLSKLFHCHQHGNYMFRFDIHERISDCSNKSYDEETCVKLDMLVLNFLSSTVISDWSSALLKLLELLQLR
jgi:hypothetical protein